MNSDQELLSRLETLEKTLQDKLEILKRPVLQVEEDLKHVLGTIALLKRDSKPLEINERTTLSSKLHGMTQLAAVVTIAKESGGIVRAQDAKRLMIRAGIMSDSKNATNMTHNVITRSDKFERIAPGEYRLKNFGHLKRVKMTFEPAEQKSGDSWKSVASFAPADPDFPAEPTPRKVDRQDLVDLLAADKRVTRQ